MWTKPRDDDLVGCTTDRITITARVNGGQEQRAAGRHRDIRWSVGVCWISCLSYWRRPVGVGSLIVRYPSARQRWKGRKEGADGAVERALRWSCR